MGHAVRDFSCLSQPPFCLPSATFKDVSSVLLALYHSLFLTSCPPTLLLNPFINLSVHGCLHFLPSNLIVSQYFKKVAVFLLDNVNFESCQDKYLTLPCLLIQYSHGLDNYITPEQWRSARNRCFMQVRCYLLIVAIVCLKCCI